MNLEQLYDIINTTTYQFRKGPERTDHQVGPLQVTEIYNMPHEEVAGPELEMVDVEFLKIGVDKAKAAARKADLINILQGYPEPERLAGGPSYIEVGGVIGDQGAAFQLFALGKVLGLWDLITPSKFGMSGQEARDAAGSGFIMITGWRPEDARAA